MSNRPPQKRGPNTVDGKLRSSRNSTDHGLCSGHFRLLPGESADEFEAVRKAWLHHYELQANGDPAILLAIEKLAQDDWLTRRGMQAACDAQHRFATAQSADEPEETLEKLERRLLLMIRYKTALENSKNRTLREIEMMLARAKREECQERVVFMKENALALNIVATQTKLGIPHSTPYRPAPEIRHGELRTENREPAEKHP